jgi:hypothetical protein
VDNQPMDFLDQTFFGNPVRIWALAGAGTGI